MKEFTIILNKKIMTKQTRSYVLYTVRVICFFIQSIEISDLKHSISVSVISSDPPYKDGNVQFTTVTLNL